MLITTGNQKDKLAIKLIPQMQHMNRQRSHSILRTNLPRFRPKTPSIKPCRATHTLQGKFNISQDLLVLSLTLNRCLSQVTFSLHQILMKNSYLSRISGWQLQKFYLQANDILVNSKLTFLSRIRAQRVPHSQRNVSFCLLYPDLLRENYMKKYQASILS